MLVPLNQRNPKPTKKTLKLKEIIHKPKQKKSVPKTKPEADSPKSELQTTSPIENQQGRRVKEDCNKRSKVRTIHEIKQKRIHGNIHRKGNSNGK